MARSELESARAVADEAGVEEHRVVRLPDLREAEDIDGAEFYGLPPTYIPMRNSIFYSFAASYAEETSAKEIVGGHNRDDSRVFRDVSADFFGALQRVMWAGSNELKQRRLRIVRPVRSKTKVQVIRLAASLGVPLQLTWSCHREGRLHCWKCDGCISRREAFRLAEVPDPLNSSRTGKIT
jgi:7-cyano-7-deazaguanine synthase